MVCVCLLSTAISPAKPAEPIEMSFGGEAGEPLLNGRPNPVTGRGAVVEGGTYVGRLPVKKHSVWGGGAVWNEDGYMPHTKSTDVKNVFYVFLFRSRFYGFNVFFIFQTFLFKKRWQSSERQAH